jgi:hypothetical protein
VGAKARVRETCGFLEHSCFFGRVLPLCVLKVLVAGFLGGFARDRFGFGFRLKMVLTLGEADAG